MRVFKLLINFSKLFLDKIVGGILEKVRIVRGNKLNSFGSRKG